MTGVRVCRESQSNDCKTHAVHSGARSAQKEKLICNFLFGEYPTRISLHVGRSSWDIDSCKKEL